MPSNSNAMSLSVHAAGAQVAAPDRDLAEVDRELELRVDVAQRARRLVGLGVVHHDAEGTVGNAARAVLDLPLRVDPAHLAVALDDAIALRVAAGAARRVGVDPARAILGMNVLDRVVVVRRSLGRIDAPEAEHVLVPAAFARGNRALPDAEPAEFLGGLEQLVLARARVASARVRVTSLSVQRTHAPSARAVRLDPERRSRRAAQLDRAAVAPRRAEHARERQPTFGARGARAA